MVMDARSRQTIDLVQSRHGERRVQAATEEA